MTLQSKCFEWIQDIEAATKAQTKGIHEREPPKLLQKVARAM